MAQYSKDKIFPFSFLPIILIFITIILLICLGFWQLDRAQQKKDINSALEIANNAELELINSVDKIVNKHYYNVILNGNYLIQKQFIYDNQIVQQKAGYYVLTPFLIKGSNKAIIVNRGFIAWQGTREISTDININNDKTQIVVQLIPIPEKRIELGNSEIIKKFPLMIQAINIELMADLIELDLVDSFALLSPDSDDGFIKRWQPYVGSVDRHIGYAIQWFLMALVLAIIGVFLIIKNKKSNL